MKATLIVTILILTVPSHAQDKASPAGKDSTVPEPKAQNVYYQSWDEGEVKSCSTYSGQPSLVECDGAKLAWKEAFINLLGNYAAAGVEEAHHRAFLYAIAHSKLFLISFSEEPWPKPQTGRKEAMWNCTKDKV